MSEQDSVNADDVISALTQEIAAGARARAILQAQLQTALRERNDAFEQVRALKGDGGDS